MEKSIRMEKKDLSFTKLHRVSKQAAYLKTMKSLFRHPGLKVSLRRRTCSTTDIRIRGTSCQPERIS